MRLRPLYLATALALLTLFPLQATEQYRPKILRSLNRSGSFHLSQSATFSFDLLQAVGGVLSQTGALLTDTAEAATFSVTIDVNADGYPGYVTVRHMATRMPYPIEYADLVPMALFVDSGGTALYTYWQESGLPDRFLDDAVFVEHPIRGHVALEFGATRYADALYYVDLCRGCLGYRTIDVNASLETRLWKTAAGRSGSSHLITDVGLPFRITVVDGRADLSGGVARFNWSTSYEDRHVRITAQPLLPEPDSTVQNSLGNFTDLDLLTSLHEEAVEPLMDAAASVDNAASRSLNAGFFLFETLALLRTAKTDAPSEWSDFMELLRSDRLVNADPLPWDRYTSTVCDTYPTTTECLN